WGGGVGAAGRGGAGAAGFAAGGRVAPGAAAAGAGRRSAGAGARDRRLGAFWASRSRSGARSSGTQSIAGSAGGGKATTAEATNVPRKASVSIPTITWATQSSAAPPNRVAADGGRATSSTSTT